MLCFATNAGGGNGTLERNAYNSVLNTGDSNLCVA